MSMKGKVHSFQSFGAVDGPGIRFVVFMQGCPYSCPYCHNPDTRPFSGGTEYTVDEIVAKAERYRTYFGEKGGVTVLHDKTLHDYPSYTGSYTQSAKTIKAYLKKYPSIKVVLTSTVTP